MSSRNSPNDISSPERVAFDLLKLSLEHAPAIGKFESLEEAAAYFLRPYSELLTVVRTPLAAESAASRLRRLPRRLREKS